MAKLNRQTKAQDLSGFLPESSGNMAFLMHAGQRSIVEITGDASDVVGLPGIHVEAKHQENMRLYDWIEQARRDAEANGKRVTSCGISQKE